jgi:hypothetical protein
MWSAFATLNATQHVQQQQNTAGASPFVNVSLAQTNSTLENWSFYKLNL